MNHSRREETVHTFELLDTEARELVVQLRELAGGEYHIYDFPAVKELFQILGRRNIDEA